MPLSNSSGGDAYIEQLSRRCGCTWPTIQQARSTTTHWRAILEALLPGADSADANVVVYGSMARQEMSEHSDLDWTLLLDKPVDPADFGTAQQIATKIAGAGFAPPGATNVFGSMTSSHSLVHDIGGQDDTNANTTRRILLLLESYPPSCREAYDRVRRHILDRYVEDDYGLSFGSNQNVVPRFLLNDLTRYWRTVTVDFVHKQRADAGGKWALRNAKLRMSRKLIFAAGLLVCFGCHLDPEAEVARRAIRAPNPATDELIRYLESQFSHPPLEILARAALRYGTEECCRLLFGSYNEFLAVVGDEGKRNVLKDLAPSGARTNPHFQEIRDISHRFQEGLTRLFYRDSSEIRELTETYGVF